MIQKQNDYWIPLAISAASAAVSLKFAVQLVDYENPPSLYLVANSSALVAFAASLFFWRSVTGVKALAGLMTLVQLLHGVVSLIAGDVGWTLVPVVLACLTAASVVYLSRKRG